MTKQRWAVIVVVVVVVVAGISFLALRVLEGKRSQEAGAEATRQVRESPNLTLRLGHNPRR